MAMSISVTVVPGPPDIPVTLQIECRGLGRDKEIELVINDGLRGEAIVPVDGDVSRAVALTLADKTSLLDIAQVSATIKDDQRAGATLCRMKTALGDSLAIRYKV